MRSSITALVPLLIVFAIGCQQNSQTADTDASIEQPETQVFLNIDVPALQDAALKHFGDVIGHGSVAKSEPGSPGFVAMKGRRFQTFRIQGTISADGREALLAQLESDIQTVLNENGATIVGEITNTIVDRPAYLSQMFAMESQIDRRELEGFYLEYSTASGNGSVDVIACNPSETDGDNTWVIGFAIHEPHQAE